MRTRTDRELLEKLYKLRRELGEDQQQFERHFTSLINAIKETLTLSETDRRDLVLKALTRWQTLTLDEIVEETELSEQIAETIVRQLVATHHVISSRRYSPFLKNPNDRQEIFTLVEVRDD